MLKIWGRVNSINVQKVMWAVGELKIPHERVDAGMAFGVVNTPEYRKMNPNGRVPTIDYDGFVLWESNVIVRYLYARHGKPRSLEQGYSEEKWMDWTTSTVGAPLTTVFWQLIRTPGRQAGHTPRSRRRSSRPSMFEDRRRRARAQPTSPVASSRWGTSRSAASSTAGSSSRSSDRTIRTSRSYYERLKARPAFRQHVGEIPLT